MKKDKEVDREAYSNEDNSSSLEEDSKLKLYEIIKNMSNSSFIRSFNPSTQDERMKSLIEYKESLNKPSNLIDSFEVVEVVDFEDYTSRRDEKELREIRINDNIEKIAISNDELNANSRKMYTLMNLMQNEILTQNENSKEFNDKVDKLVIELKDISEGVNKSKTVSSFFSDLAGNIAVAVMLEYLKLQFYS